MASDIGKTVPRFIQVRGCNNCEVYGAFWEKYGRETGFDEECHLKCKAQGCDYYQVNLIAPFTDPEEVLNRASFERMFGQEEGVKSAIDYCEKVKKRFGEHYQKIGVALDGLVEDYLVALKSVA